MRPGSAMGSAVLSGKKDDLITSGQLLIVGGQSNAISSGVSSVPAAVAAIDGNRVKIWSGAAFAAYDAATNGSTNPPKWGPEAGYAIRWLADNPGKALYIVKRPVGGSRIATWISGGTNFDNLTTWVDAAKAALAVAEIEVLSTVILFCQGESDAIVDQTLANAYQASFTQFASDARSEWASAGDKIGAMLIYDQNMIYSNTVRKAQNAVSYPDANMQLAYTEDFTLVDTYHYNTAGIQELGDRLYDAVVSNFGVDYNPTTQLSNMTAADAPAGYEASASSEFSGSFPAWHAIDGDSGTRWASALAVGTATITHRAPSAFTMGALNYLAYSEATQPATISLYGSNNGVDFDLIQSFTSLSWADSGATGRRIEVNPDNRAPYQWHRLALSGSSGGGYSAYSITYLGEG